MKRGGPVAGVETRPLRIAVAGRQREEDAA